MKKVFSISSSILFCLLSMVNAQETLPSFELSGVIKAANQNQDVFFKCYVDGCNWKIVLDEQGKTIEVGTQEGDLYLLEYTDEADWPEEDKYVASIIPGPVPEYQSPYPYYPIIWFALASGCYFSESGYTNQVTLYPPHTYGNRRQLVSTHVSYQKTFAGMLPRLITFMHPGSEMSSGPLPAPYDQGFKSATLEMLNADKSLNSSNLLSFRFQAFFPDFSSGKSTNDLVLGKEFNVAVTNFSDRCSINDFRPEFPPIEVLGIMDKRASVKPFNYEAREWESVESFTSRPDFIKWSQLNNPNFRENKKYARVLVVILIFLLLPIFFLLARNFIRTKNEQV